MSYENRKREFQRLKEAGKIIPKVLMDEFGAKVEIPDLKTDDKKSEGRKHGK